MSGQSWLWAETDTAGAVAPASATAEKAMRTRRRTVSQLCQCQFILMPPASADYLTNR